MSGDLQCIGSFGQIKGIHQTIELFDHLRHDPLNIKANFVASEKDNDRARPTIAFSRASLSSAPVGGRPHETAIGRMSRSSSTIRASRHRRPISKTFHIGGFVRLDVRRLQRMPPHRHGKPVSGPSFGGDDAVLWFDCTELTPQSKD
jgi:hypothetical protein